MKKLFSIIIVSLVLLSCGEGGRILNSQSGALVEINGVMYRYILIQPHNDIDYDKAVWTLVPVGSVVKTCHESICDTRIID